jgi:hypothetical protein
MNDRHVSPVREGKPELVWRWLPWLAVVVAVTALIWCFMTRQEIPSKLQVGLPTPIPSPCDPDHIITIQKNCSPYPFELDPVLPGHTIMFKNGMGSPITIEVEKGIFADSTINIPTGGAACRTLELECEYRPFTYLVVGTGCGSPPIEARPRIIVHSSPND